MSQPANTNFLSPVGFTLSIEKLKDVAFFAQNVVLPSVDMGMTFQDTPMLDISIPGDKLTFSDLVVEFIVDEDMVGYKSIFNWMVGLAHPESLDQYSAFHQAEAARLVGKYNSKDHSPMYSDGTLEILSNMNNINGNKVHFVDMFPIGLSGVNFSTTVNDIQYLTARATFAYSHFNFI